MLSPPLENLKELTDLSHPFLTTVSAFHSEEEPGMQLYFALIVILVSGWPREVGSMPLRFSQGWTLIPNHLGSRGTHGSIWSRRAEPGWIPHPRLEINQLRVCHASGRAENWTRRDSGRDIVAALRIRHSLSVFSNDMSTNATIIGLSLGPHFPGDMLSMSHVVLATKA